MAAAEASEGKKSLTDGEGLDWVLAPNGCGERERAGRESGKERHRLSASTSQLPPTSPEDTKEPLERGWLVVIVLARFKKKKPPPAPEFLLSNTAPKRHTSSLAPRRTGVHPSTFQRLKESASTPLKRQGEDRLFSFSPKPCSLPTPPPDKSIKWGFPFCPAQTK